MPRAEELFARFKADGLAMVDEMIAAGVGEELFLDFKRSADDGAGTALNNKDRRNLERATSGFGNSEGGVILWGVDCREDRDRGDVPIGIVPIAKPMRFKGWLERISSGLTVPVHAGVEHAVAVQEGGGGVVATLIPKSNHAPHQTVSDQAYYMRAGSNFVRVPHSVLAGMFGRRPQPDVFHQLLTKPAAWHGGERLDNESAVVEIGVLLTNRGPGIAEDIFANLDVAATPGEHCQIAYTTPDPDTWTGRFSFGRHMSVISKPGFRLPPEALIQPFAINMRLRPPFTSSLKLEGICGCAGAPFLEIRREVTANRLTWAFEYLKRQIGAGQGAEAAKEFPGMLLQDNEELGDA